MMERAAQKLRVFAHWIICDHSFCACDHIISEICLIAPKNRAFEGRARVTPLSKPIKRLSGTGKDSDHG
jgi:hypothetical protein